MHGREGEEWRKQYGNLHMRTVTTRVGVERDADGSLSSPASCLPSFFCKDGRKISVGDCALFKTSQGSPPSIGLVCSLTSSKENGFTLGVNWLYRVTEVKLGKGIQLDAAPNEVFYSLRRNAISSSSLLHPCKVAFLPKGVELPLGVSSFICRRVYDIKNSHLWWLTGKNYQSEHQEEINQLLYKTRLEMHASAQPNGQSPKINVTLSTAQLKPVTDSVQDTASFQAQSKGKKRERGDQSSDLVKRERGEQSSDLVKREHFSKLEDADSDHLKSENLFKSEIAKLVEKGTLTDSEGVERLVQVMFYAKSERKVDLSARSVLINVIAGTDKLDFLRRFVQLRGLSVLDEWLQEIHKGKIGDDKSVEEFIFLLLRALEKLPVNLQALQLCNIGKSVNHLRTHKNSEIQRKARSLVDTWKKRVAAEMNITDTRSGANQAMSWPARSCLPEAAHGSRQTGGSSEVVPKSHIVQLSSAKTAPAKLALGETSSKPGSPVSTKVATSPVALSSSFKDGQNKPTVAEKSSSSSPSPNHSQSCSSDHANTGAVFAKEDVRSSTAGSNKLSSKSKKSIDGFSGSGGKESGPSRRGGSFQRNFTPENASQSGLTGEKLQELSAEDNNHKLIDKLPIGPTPTVAGESLYDASIVNSRASSPSPSHRPGQLDVGGEKGVSYRANDSANANVSTESWQSNDFRDILTPCDDGIASDVRPDEDHHLVAADEDTKKMPNLSGTGFSLLEDAMKSGKLSESSLSSMNALIATCVDFSETITPPTCTGDDVGMNLLASVAAGEIFQSEPVSPIDSLKRDVGKQDCAGNGSEMNSSPRDCHEDYDHELSSENNVRCAPLSDKGDCKTMEEAAEPFAPIKTGHELTVASVAASPSSAVPEGAVQSLEKTLVNGNPDVKMKVESSDIKISLKSEKGCGQDNCGLIELKPSEKILAETGKKGQKNIDEIKAEKVGEIDVTHDKQNVLKSDPLTMDSATISEKDSEASECKLPVLGSKADDVEECSSTNTVPAPVKLMFDLNEGLETEGSRYGEVPNYRAPISAAIPMVSPSLLSVSSCAVGLTAPIAVAAAAKGPFVPPNDLLRTKGELGGWKGSAATSAFRPAEPRKVLETPIGTLKPTDYLNASSVRQSRAPLDFDLNDLVPDERIIEEAAPRHPVLQMASCSYNNSRSNSRRELVNLTPASGSGGLDLDLNILDEAEDVGSSAVGYTCKLDASLLPIRSACNTPADVGSRRGFDLNDRPVLDNILSSEPSTSGQYFRNSVLPQHTFPGRRMNNNDLGNFSTWFQTGSERGEQPFPIVAAGGAHPRMFGPSSGISLNPEMYRGSVLSSSPAMPFSSTPFQYSVFPYGPSFPLPSGSLSGTAAAYVDPATGGRIFFPPVHSQLSGPTNAVSSPFPRPYVVNLSDGSGNSGGGDSSKRWNSRVGLDLNMGPGGLDVEGRDESSHLVPRQLSVSGSGPLTEEQARMFHVTNGVLKRKEPDCGWDSYRQQSWHQ